MQEREARLLKESGDLDKVVIGRSMDRKGWSMKLVAKNGDAQMLNSKRSKDPRVFKTSDAALRCCLRIGVNNAVVAI